MSLLNSDSYLNFLKSKLKSRIDFLEHYTLVFTELIPDVGKDFLKNIRLKEAELPEVLLLEQKVQKIEQNIEVYLKSLAENTLISHFK